MKLRFIQVYCVENSFVMMREIKMIDWFDNKIANQDWLFS